MRFNVAQMNPSYQLEQSRMQIALFISLVSNGKIVRTKSIMNRQPTGFGLIRFERLISYSRRMSLHSRWCSCVSGHRWLRSKLGRPIDGLSNLSASRDRAKLGQTCPELRRVDDVAALLCPMIIVEMTPSEGKSSRQEPESNREPKRKQANKTGK